MTDILTMPDVHWSAIQFEAVQVRQSDRMEGRRTEELVMPQTWWRASYETEQLDARELGRLEAFGMLAGAGAVFRAFDPRRPRPMAHDEGRPLAGTRASGGAFDGTATLSAIVDATTISISTLPAGFTLLMGDYVELRMSPLLVTLHKVTADAVADANGTVALSFRHALDLQHFTTAAVVNLEKPCCLMKIEPGSFKPSQSRVERRVSFSAQEHFPEVAE